MQGSHLAPVPVWTISQDHEFSAVQWYPRLSVSLDAESQRYHRSALNSADFASSQTQNRDVQCEWALMDSNLQKQYM